MSTGKVRIEMTGHGQGKVYVDGAELTNVESVSFRSRGGRVNRVHVVLYAAAVTIIADKAEVYTPVKEYK